ncbi:hypothetical protein N0V90_000906 [Kalmusia sp. IMI 367209]|nr:hypothetical protein N0V90_000906 [Kalmusia sp. IMI 367209]
MPTQGQSKRPTPDERPAKRSRVSRYIRTLELALTWLFQNTDSEAVLNRKLAQEGSSSILLGRDTRESNRLHKSWRRSKFCKDVDKLLSGEQLGPEDDQSLRSEDEDSEPEGEQSRPQDQHPLLPPEEEVSPSAHFVSPGIALPIQQVTSTSHDDLETPGSRHQHSVVATPLPTSTWRLLEVYFAYTQSWLPICEKHDILKISYSYPENGLALSLRDLPNHGEHAELWSILAVGAHQERMVAQETERHVLQEPTRLYDVARSLIPTESGAFEIGHVRALLNLAVVNLACANTEGAWLLVGSACRILVVVERSSQAIPTRWKHLLAGCFMLDSFLSLQLNRRPYLQKSDLDRGGPIEEDGLEEWQPWSSPLQASPSAFSRTPALSLSSFNKLMDVVAILNMCHLDGSPTIMLHPHQLVRQLETWKASLSAKFNYIIDELKATPLNPPAILLQLTYLSCASGLLSSSTYFQRISELLEQYLVQLGVAAVPPTVLCLLSHLQANSAFTTLDIRLQGRLRRFETDVIRAWSASHPQNGPLSTQIRPSINAYQVPTPESIQIPFNSSFTPLDSRPRSNRQRASASLLDDLLPDMNNNVPSNRLPVHHQDLGMPPLEDEFRRPSIRHRNSAASRDLETFFDELASLDGAEMVDNQPQFMQNLGFAPDANMADFLALELGQFIPSNSGTFMPQNNDPTHLDPVFFDGT